MHLHSLWRCSAPVLLGGALFWAQGAVGAEKAQTKAAAQAVSSGTAGTQPLPSSVRFIDAPSSEKPAARERRLKRECKGRPNAGVCLGYTR